MLAFQNCVSFIRNVGLVMNSLLFTNHLYTAYISMPEVHYGFFHLVLRNNSSRELCNNDEIALRMQLHFRSPMYLKCWTRNISIQQKKHCA